MRNRAGLAILAALSVVPSTAAAEVGGSLPTAERTLTADQAVKRDCSSGTATGEPGVATTFYRTKAPGFVTVRTAGSARSDWDLALFDKGTGAPLASSAGFGSREVAQTWVDAGERVLIQACRRKGGQRRLRLAISLADVDSPAVEGSPMLLRVPFRSTADLDRLDLLGADVTHHVHDGQADVIVANATHANVLRNHGFEFDVEIGNLTRHYQRSRLADLRYSARVRKSSLPSGRTTYRVYDDYQREMKEIVEQFPSIAKPVVFPRRTFQGREIQAVEFGEDVRGADDGKPVFLLVAMHHSREWPSSESAMEFMHMIVQGYGADERITKLLQNSRVVVAPLINADGFISSRGWPADPADILGGGGRGRPIDPDADNPGLGIDPDLADPCTSRPQPDFDAETCAALRTCALVGRDEETGECGADLDLYLLEGIAPPGGIMSFRRKNCNGLVPDGRFPCELQYGVDPNRNYGYNWGGPGSSSEVFSQSYRGTGPWSEPETQAVHEFSQRRQVTNILTIHNVAALVLRPPGVSGEGRAPDEEALKRVGDAMGRETGYKSQYGFELYDTSGTTEDWNYAQQGAFGYTIEIGPKDGEFHMPYETGFVREWDGTTSGQGGLREAYLIAWEAAVKPAYHSVISGTAPPGRVLRLSKEFVTRTHPACARQLVSINPLNSDLIYSNYQVATGQEFPCPDQQPELEVPDGLETTMTVPASGRFEWHVNPSTRPFVGAPRTVDAPVVEERTLAEGSGVPGDPPPTAGFDSASDTVTEFTVDGAVAFVLELTAPRPADDYDLYLCKKVSADECEPVGTGLTDTGESGSFGTPERITVDSVEPVTYVATVTNFAAPANEWTLTVTEYGGGVIEPGHKEAWTLTCESANGKVVYDTRDVIVDRGQRVEADLPCGDPSRLAGQRGARGDGGPQGPAGRDGESRARHRSARAERKAKKKRKFKKKKRALAKKRKACVRKARKRAKKRDWGAKRKKAAVKRCKQTHQRKLRKLKKRHRRAVRR